ncbi:class I SAM-dependent methyltransferase, partial [Pseudomonas sp. CrR25]|nr:class I SAM-dependent methyltransferase [Pseudomonas sp. CrR25]
MDRTRFYDATQGDPALPTLLQALGHWQGAPGLALDLGCGAGRDSLELLRHGWRVLAVDMAPQALERLHAQVPAEQAAALHTLCARFEEIELPPAELINSSFALPLCPPEAFPALWQRIERALA